MKTYTKDPTAALSRWTYILRLVFSIALIMPVFVLSQTLAPVNLGTAGNSWILAKTGVLPRAQPISQEISGLSGRGEFHNRFWLNCRSLKCIFEIIFSPGSYMPRIMQPNSD